MTVTPSPAHLSRKGFILLLIAALVLSYAPDLIAAFSDAPLWMLEWPVLVALGAVLIFAARQRLRDAGAPVHFLWQALLAAALIYALFASPLAGLIPVPGLLSTLALIGANGLVFGGLAFLVLKPAALAIAPQEREQATSALDERASLLPVATALEPALVLADTPKTNTGDATHSGATHSGDGGADGSGGAD